jgi:hypothetical protein
MQDDDRFTARYLIRKRLRTKSRDSGPLSSDGPYARNEPKRFCCSYSFRKSWIELLNSESDDLEITRSRAAIRDR